MSEDAQDEQLAGNCARIEEQATYWFTLMSSDTRTEQDILDHQVWMNSNPAHEKEYQELEKMWELLGSFAQKPEVINECWHIKPPNQQQARQGNVGLQQEITQLQQKSNRLQQLSARLQLEAQEELVASASTETSRSFYPTFNALAASLLVIILSSGLVFQGPWFNGIWDRLFDQPVYQTAVGEQKLFYLTDGSSVVLDTHTIVSTNFSDDIRHVVLERGQASFNVTRDQNRPFVVQAGNGTTTAIGTTFIVRKNEDNTLVTLIEGKVAVTQNSVSKGKDGILFNSVSKKDDSQPSTKTVYHEVLLQEGQQVIYSEQGLSEAKVVDIERVSAWQQGRLIFEDYSMREVLDELNRYSDKKIVLGDKSLASLRVTGVFKSGDNRKAIQALKAYFSMRVTTDLQGNLVLLQTESDPLEN